MSNVDEDFNELLAENKRLREEKLANFEAWQGEIREVERLQEDLAFLSQRHELDRMEVERLQESLEALTMWSQNGEQLCFRTHNGIPMGMSKKQERLARSALADQPTKSKSQIKRENVQAGRGVLDGIEENEELQARAAEYDGDDGA